MKNLTKRIMTVFALAVVLSVGVVLTACGKKDDPKPTEYTITWSVNGTTTTTKVAKDGTPSYSGALTKASDSEYDYSFKEWQPAIVKATQDTTYTAIWNQTPKTPITVSVTGVTLNETNKTLTTGSDFTLTATVAPSNATNKAISGHLLIILSLRYQMARLRRFPQARQQ